MHSHTNYFIDVTTQKMRLSEAKAVAQELGLTAEKYDEVYQAAYESFSKQYDLFDMEAYAAAQFCKMYDIPFYCLKAVSDNLDGNLKDWRSILADIRVRFTELLWTGKAEDSAE